MLVYAYVDILGWCDFMDEDELIRLASMGTLRVPFVVGWMDETGWITILN
jgi:hypothetical protein